MKINHDFENATYYIGDCAKDNTEMLDLFDKDDIWLHLDGRPSAHVYMVLDEDFKNTKPTKKDILKMVKIGGLLVRENSKKTRGVVEICYLKRKFLKKGSVEGEVILKKDPSIIKI
jgi:predicted ribosome quality control (RQC) complex YloA/Tae2 family protein